jgi:hypothetical protein
MMEWGSATGDRRHPNQWATADWPSPDAFVPASACASDIFRVGWWWGMDGHRDRHSYLMATGV